MRPTLWSDERAAAYRGAGYWTGDTYVEALARHATASPDAVALADEDRALSWSEAQRWTAAAAVALARSLPRDAVLATWLPNSVEHYLLRFAAEAAGVVWLPVTYSAGAAELREALAASAAAGLVCANAPRRDAWGEVESLLPTLPLLRWRAAVGEEGPAGVMRLDGLPRPTPNELAEVRGRSIRPGDLAMLISTSGSTGAPKLCEYALDGAVARGLAQKDLFGLGPRDVVVAAVQGFGPSITPVLAAPLAGAAVVVLSRHDPDTLLGAIEDHRATVVCAVPPIYRDLLPSLERCARSVRIWYSTGVAMPLALAAEIERRTAGVVCSGYGGVDLGCWTAPAPDDPPDVRQLTVGRPRGGTELRIETSEGADGAGEVLARGPSSTWGYYREPAATREAWTADGWFRTGDIGRVDANGNLVLVGRKVGVINRGGHKVHPEELERLLEEHGAVARAAVVPYPDERLGERVCAYVVLSRGTSVTLAELVSHLRARGLATYKLPERLEVVASLPVGPGGKVLRSALGYRSGSASASVR